VTTLGSLEDLLHARAVVDALLSRLAVQKARTRAPLQGRRAHLRRNLNLFDLLLNEIHIWEILENEHKTLAIEILARLIANAATDNYNREKNHE